MKNRLKEFRQKHKLSQMELASKVGITRSYLSNIENGHTNPTISIARGIANVFLVGIDDIFFDNDVRHDAQVTHQRRCTNDRI